MLFRSQTFRDRQYAIENHDVADRVRRRYEQILAEGKTPVIVDAGANIGASALWFGAEYPRAAIVAIEPEPETVAMLRKNLAGRPNMTILAAAVGARPGHVTLTNFGQDLAGEVYIIEQGGEIWRIDGTPPGTPNCAGDGSLPLDCPCSNTGTFGRGCANSANSAGALLSAVGDTASDSVRLDTSGMPTTSSCIFLKRDVYDANSVSFGDGLLCTSGSLVRLRTKIAAGGAASFPDSADTVTLSARGSTPPGSGLTGFYQTYYRNASATFCPPETFNISNGYQITW